jgi:hypothetical protein
MLTIAVDWSGAARPAGKLAFAEVVDGDFQSVRPFDSREEVASELLRQCRQTPDTIIGLDFAFSMPEWFLTERRCSTVIDLWQLVENEGETWLRDCSKPFWGRAGKPKSPLAAHFRRTEQEQVGKVKGISPKSIFQIGGAGAVGTGSLRGMPMLLRLHQKGISVWPFDPPTKPFVIEIYPRLLTGSVNKGRYDARLKHLEEQWNGLSTACRREIAQTEDTFDAAISALVMDRHSRELEQLASSDDASRRLEGEIWSPRGETPGAI